MRRAGPAALAVVACIVLSVAGSAAAMQPQGAAPARDPTRITVVKRPYDRKQLVSAPALPEAAYRGRTIWLQRCAYCHDGVGQPSYNTMGSWLGAETVQTLGEAAVRAIVSAGTERMPGFQYALQPRQVDDLLAFLKTVSSDTKPTPSQLAGKLPGAAPASGD